MTAQRWILVGLAGATVGAMLASAACAQSQVGPGPLAAVVNGTPIPVAELERVLKHRPLPPGSKPLTDVQQAQLRYDALAFLIDDLLMEQFLQQHGPRVDPAEVAKCVANLDATMKAQKKTLQDFCRETDQTEQQLRSNIVTMLQWTSYVKAKLSDADVKRYFDDNRDFFDQVTVRASHIMLRVSPASTESERAAARTKLLALRQDIVAGKLDFAEAAQKHSQCPSCKQGGDVGYFPRKFGMQESFARTAFALKIGDVSDVVQTDYGLHVIKVVDRRQEGQAVSFDKIKDEVREIAAEELRHELLAYQRKQAKIEVKLDQQQQLKTAKP